MWLMNSVYIRACILTSHSLSMFQCAVELLVMDGCAYPSLQEHRKQWEVGKELAHSLRKVSLLTAYTLAFMETP